MFHLLLHVQITVFLSEGSEKVYIAGEFCVRSEMKVTQSCPTLCNPTDYTVHGILQARILEWIAFPVSWRSSQPRDQPRSPTLQADSLPAEPQRKPKSTGVGSLSILQQIFLTQESNQGILHCRWILYQLSYLLNLAKGFLRIAKIFFKLHQQFLTCPDRFIH